jgi:ClpP class serine protease
MFKSTRELSKLLSSRLFITRQAYSALLVEIIADYFRKPGSFMAEDTPSYSDTSIKVAQDKASALKLNITSDFASNNIPEDSIAFHRIKDLILAENNGWYFSSKKFRNDLLVADSNPNVISHFIALNSGGGEAWFLDVVADTMKNLSKPKIAHIESVGASAGVYLVMNADKIYAATPNETIGSIGTMVGFLDIIPILEKLGARQIEEYSSISDLKNKKFNDLLDGKPEQYIKEELDPLAQQFVDRVIEARPLTGKLDRKEDPLFRGETFNTQESIEKGLIDGQMLMEDALLVARDMGMAHKEKTQKLNKLFKTI